MIRVKLVKQLKSGAICVGESGDLSLNIYVNTLETPKTPVKVIWVYFQQSRAIPWSRIWNGKLYLIWKEKNILHKMLDHWGFKQLSTVRIDAGQTYLFILGYGRLMQNHLACISLSLTNAVSYPNFSVLIKSGFWAIITSENLTLRWWIHQGLATGKNLIGWSANLL